MAVMVEAVMMVRGNNDNDVVHNDTIMKMILRMISMMPIHLVMIMKDTMMRMIMKMLMMTMKMTISFH